MCGSSYIKIKNREGRQGFYFILYIFFTLILWEIHCDSNSAYCKMAKKSLGQGLKIRVGRAPGTTHIFLFGLSTRGYHRPSNQCFCTNMVYQIYLSDLSRFWLSCLGPLAFLHPKILKLYGFQIFWLLSVPDTGYSRNVSCRLNLIYMFFIAGLSKL